MLGVSRSGYYKWLRRRGFVTERQIKREIVTRKVKEIFNYHRKRYGAIRIGKELKKEGITVSSKLVNTIMKDNHLVSLHTKKYKVVTTNSNHTYAVAKNTLNREFNPDTPNQVWAADITYIRVIDGWMYLAVVLDLFNKKIVGYQTSRNINTRLVLDALEQALYTRRPREGLLFHSDRGVQFASDDFISAIGKANITQSMSRKGNCWDNSPVESFFATLKKELIYPLGICSDFQMERELFEYIEAYYNTVRIHSSLGYLSPLEFEKMRLAA